jgi:hypothetical protein
MANPLLRRVAVAAFTANTDTTVVSAVPAARALVISKIVVANTSGGSLTFRVLVGGAAIAYDIPLAAAQVYTETGLVAATGETVQARSSILNGITVTVCGEEVDN